MYFFFRRIVIDTLKEVDGDRKCFNMIGGVLCERTVKEVLPILISNQEQVGFTLYWFYCEIDLHESRSSWNTLFRHLEKQKLKKRLRTKRCTVSVKSLGSPYMDLRNYRSIIGR